LRILIVEDEGLIALNLELMLRRFGCEVVGLVSQVGDIVDAVKKHHPDGILLDVNLRGRKVFDVLAEVVSLGVPCVLSSGYDDPTQFPAAFRNLPRIAKPFDESALRRVCVEFGSLAEARQADQGRETRMKKSRRANARSFSRGQRFAFPYATDCSSLAGASCDARLARTFRMRALRRLGWIRLTWMRAHSPWGRDQGNTATSAIQRY